MKKLAFLIAGLVMAACGETPTQTPTMVEAPVAMNFVNAPEVSGVVTRGDGILGMSWIDPDTGLRIILGFDPEELCAGNFNFAVVPTQFVGVNDSREMWVYRTSVQTTVWDLFDFDCELFADAEPIAVGESRVTYHDNDFSSIQEGETHQNAWGWNVHGILDLAAGGRARLQAHAYGTADGEGMVWRSMEINLK